MTSIEQYDMVRTTTCLYNDFGEQVGTVLDGITNRTDTTYAEVSNEWWKVETATTIGPETNSVAITRNQLTGLSAACRRHAVTLVGCDDLNAPQTITETIAAFDPSTGLETETTTSSIAAPTVRQSLYGLVLANETSGTATVSDYDAFARVAARSRTIGEGEPLPLQSFDYSPAGDLLATHTYTNGTDIITETYAYDMLGNQIAVTDALGNTIFKSFDPFGNVVAEWGATYPVRYTYDTQGRRTSLSTTRDGETWDTTSWTYDPATGNCVSKTYADSSTVTYTYTANNLNQYTTILRVSAPPREPIYDTDGDAHYGSGGFPPLALAETRTYGTIHRIDGKLRHSSATINQRTRERLSLKNHRTPGTNRDGGVRRAGPRLVRRGRCHLPRPASACVRVRPFAPCRA